MVLRPGARESSAPPVSSWPPGLREKPGGLFFARGGAGDIREKPELFAKGLCRDYIIN